MIRFYCNHELVESENHPATSLLDFLRQNLKLKGTKEGCREGDCGACTVLVGSFENKRLKYRAINSCLMPLGACEGKHIVTIEGLMNYPNFLQRIFIEEAATQCGFCTPGFIISLTGYLLSCKKFNYHDALNAIAGNICRCTGHTTIKRALEKIMKHFSKKNADEDRIILLCKEGVLPSYFRTISLEMSMYEFRTAAKYTGKELIISGGTDIMLQQGEKLLYKNVACFDSDDDKNILVKQNYLYISGNTTLSGIEESAIIEEHYPELKYFLKLFGSKQIRNRATVAGNIVNASPIADMVNILLALDAVLVLKNRKTQRIIKLSNFFKGYKKIDLNAGEIVHHLKIPIVKNKYVLSYEKVSKRTYLDIASVNSTMFTVISEDKNIKVRISAGGVAPYPLYLKATSEFLTKFGIDADSTEKAIEIVKTEIAPISDIRGSKEYKILLLRQLLIAHFGKYNPALREAFYEKC